MFAYSNYLARPLALLQLWGKLETLGLGTALKIMLFSSDDEGQKELASLNRNELIALVNTAAQLAKSVGSVPGWRWLGEQRAFPFILLASVMYRVTRERLCCPLRPPVGARLGNRCVDAEPENVAVVVAVVACRVVRELAYIALADKELSLSLSLFCLANKR